jgi:rfaE bifunctional protein nucleotidyltransferase chain/domain
MAGTAHKILDWDEVAHTVDTWKSHGDEIVFSNGCFDILHLGHVDYLERSRDLGDRLIVGLNTDRSVKELKGKNRPIVNEHARARIIASLAFVDAVVLFDEPTPLKLIKTIQPDILVKGEDYRVEDIVGSREVLESGGRVETLSLVKGLSTSELIKKIKD